jgi:hypothetical protein
MCPGTPWFLSQALSVGRDQFFCGGETERCEDDSQGMDVMVESCLVEDEE